MRNASIFPPSDTSGGYDPEVVNSVETNLMRTSLPRGVFSENRIPPLFDSSQNSGMVAVQIPEDEKIMIPLPTSSEPQRIPDTTPAMSDGYSSIVDPPPAYSTM